MGSECLRGEGRYIVNNDEGVEEKVVGWRLSV